MDEIWKTFISFTGISGVAAFVLYALYKDWLHLEAFASLSKQQRYNLFKLFLILTFVFAIAGLSLSAYEKYIDQKNQNTSRIELKKILESRGEDAEKIFEKAKKNPLISIDPNATNDLESFHAEYKKTLHEGITALNDGNFNLYHEKNAKLVSILTDPKLKAMIPDLDASKYVQLDKPCTNCV